MDTILTIRGKHITVQFRQHALHIITNDELTGLLTQDANKATMELTAEIKKEYHKIFNEEFAVSDDSVAVEIWGHVYADEFADWIKKISSITLIDSIADKVIHHSEIIDIGESGHDSNRFVWDGLAVFKSLIAAFLP